MGIRKKITIGFVCLAFMLAFSGMVSLFELSRLSGNTRDLLEKSSGSMELSKRMLDAVQQQNTAVLRMTVLGHMEIDPEFAQGRDHLEQALEDADKTPQDRVELDPIYTARNDYYSIVRKLFDEDTQTDIEWFLETYQISYYALTGAIKTYMTESQNSLDAQASQLRSNAFRAIIPGILTLCVAILMVLMFAYLIDIYYSRPLIRMADGLKGYLSHKIPFNVKVEGKDEVYRIREHIDSLITMVKSKHQ